VRHRQQLSGLETHRVPVISNRKSNILPGITDVTQIKTPKKSSRNANKFKYKKHSCSLFDIYIMNHCAQNYRCFTAASTLRLSQSRPVLWWLAEGGTFPSVISRAGWWSKRCMVATLLSAIVVAVLSFSRLSAGSLRGGYLNKLWKVDSLSEYY
jgi:hypothetical protein